MIKRFGFLFGWICLVLITCSKDDFYTGNEKVLKFEVDTLTIDTVFTSLGSATASVKIYNTGSSTVNIDQISFVNEQQTAYQINVDGNAGNNIKNVTIGPGDSTYVFVKVTVNPDSNVTQILLIESIAFKFNQTTQYLVVRSLGINAYFHVGEQITKNTTWATDKPHVVVELVKGDTITPGVLIYPNVTLTIPAGAKVFFSSQAGILCAGTLKIEGTKTDSVVMRGIRLTQQYIHNAGAWLGILYLRSSKKNTIKYAYIDESILGLYLGFQTRLKFEDMTDNTRADVFISNSVVKNAYYFTVRSWNNKIVAENSVFFTSTENVCQLALGGDYQFTHCTFYNSQSQKKKELLALSNFIYYEPEAKTYTGNLTKANFVNCVWSTTADESFSISMKEGVDSNYLFTNNLYQSKAEIKSDRFVNCKLANPKFKNVNPDREDFHLTAGSPCIDAGVDAGMTMDFDDNPRTGVPDIGAYEFK